MNHYFRYVTEVGPFFIVSRNERWHVVWCEEEIGDFTSPELAAKEVAGGHTLWPFWGNPGRLGIPAELERWERVILS